MPDIDVTKLSDADLYALAYPIDPDKARWKALAEILLRMMQKLDVILENQGKGCVSENPLPPTPGESYAHLS